MDFNERPNTDASIITFLPGKGLRGEAKAWHGGWGAGGGRVGWGGEGRGEGVGFGCFPVVSIRFGVIAVSFSVDLSQLAPALMYI